MGQFFEKNADFFKKFSILLKKMSSAMMSKANQRSYRS
jgi:hypothetical protein